MDDDKTDRIALKIGYDPAKYPETNGYYGTYLDLYLLEFTQNLQWYLDNLDYASGWTWFDEKGKALSDEEVAAMTAQDKAQAFLKGLYTKPSTGRGAGRPSRTMPTGALPTGVGSTGAASTGTALSGTASGTSMIVGTPDSGTTQSASSKVDSANYASYNEMVAAYKADVKEIYAGDKYGNNIVSLYNPLNYIHAKEMKKPVWIKLLSGAAEGDISMFNSLNLQLALLNEKIDANIEWQWDGGHVPSEVLGDSFSLYVDQMYAKHVTGSVSVKKAASTKQTKNGTATAMSGTDISSFVRSSDIKNVKVSLADAISYRLKGASKAMPGFDVIDYGQEDYVFGNTKKDARHWNIYLVEIFEKYASVLSPLFNKSKS